MSKIHCFQFKSLNCEAIHALSNRCQSHLLQKPELIVQPVHYLGKQCYVTCVTIAYHTPVRRNVCAATSYIQLRLFLVSVFQHSFHVGMCILSLERNVVTEKSKTNKQQQTQQRESE